MALLSKQLVTDVRMVRGQGNEILPNSFHSLLFALEDVSQTLSGLVMTSHVRVCRASKKEKRKGLPDGLKVTMNNVAKSSSEAKANHTEKLLYNYLQ